MTLVDGLPGGRQPRDVNLHRLALPPLHERLLSEVSEYRLFDELRTSELHDLCVRLETPVDRHADLPRTGEHFGVFDGRVVAERIRADRRVAFDDVERIAMKVPGAVEPGVRR